MEYLKNTRLLHTKKTNINRQLCWVSSVRYEPDLGRLDIVNNRATTASKKITPQMRSTHPRWTASTTNHLFLKATVLLLWSIRSSQMSHVCRHTKNKIQISFVLWHIFHTFTYPKSIECVRHRAWTLAIAASSPIYRQISKPQGFYRSEQISLLLLSKSRMFSSFAFIINNTQWTPYANN